MSLKNNVGLIRHSLPVQFVVWILLCPSKICSYPLGEHDQEPRCYSRFDYEYKVVEKLFFLEESQKKLTETIKEQQNEMKKLEDVIRTQKENLGELNKTSHQKDALVAFSAFQDETRAYSWKPITFNKVLLNEPAGVYNPESGQFTCPVSGIYVFTFVIATRGSGGRSEAFGQLRHNAKVIAEAVSESPSDADDRQGSNVAVVKLAAGDTVEVYGHGTIPGNIWGRTNTKTSSFAGFLLQPSG